MESLLAKHFELTLNSALRDIEYFRDRLSKARRNRALKDDDRVILAAEALAVKALESNPPTFVVSRMLTLQNMVDMLKDRDWAT